MRDTIVFLLWDGAVVVAHRLSVRTRFVHQVAEEILAHVILRRDLADWRRKRFTKKGGLGRAD